MLQGHDGVGGVDVRITTGERTAAVRAAATGLRWDIELFLRARA